MIIVALLQVQLRIHIEKYIHIQTWLSKLCVFFFFFLEGGGFEL
jgi:hypothetical protein